MAAVKLSIFGAGRALCNNGRYVRAAGGTRIVGSDQSGFAIPGATKLPGFAEINEVDETNKNTRDSIGYENVLQDERLYLKNFEGHSVKWFVEAELEANGTVRGKIKVVDPQSITVESPLGVLKNHGAFNALNGSDCNGRNLPFASGAMTLAGVPTDGETITIDGKIYTYKASVTGVDDVDGNVLIGPSIPVTIGNFVAAINLRSGVGVKYAESTTLHPSVRATAVGSTTTVTSVASGSKPNAIETTSSITPDPWAADKLSGGNVEVCNQEGKFVSDQDGFLFDMDSGLLLTQVSVDGLTAPETERRQFDNGPFFLGTFNGARLETICMELRQTVRFKAQPGKVSLDNPILSVRAKTHQWHGDVTKGGYEVEDKR